VKDKKDQWLYKYMYLNQFIIGLHYKGELGLGAENTKGDHEFQLTCSSCRAQGERLCRPPWPGGEEAGGGQYSPGYQPSYPSSVGVEKTGDEKSCPPTKII